MWKRVADYRDVHWEDKSKLVKYEQAKFNMRSDFQCTFLGTTDDSHVLLSDRSHSQVYNSQQELLATGGGEAHGIIPFLDNKRWMQHYIQRTLTNNIISDVWRTYPGLYMLSKDQLIIRDVSQVKRCLTTLNIPTQTPSSTRVVYGNVDLYSPCICTLDPFTIFFADGYVEMSYDKIYLWDTRTKSRDMLVDSKMICHLANIFYFPELHLLATYDDNFARVQTYDI
jgi:hypothetical protein